MRGVFRKCASVRRSNSVWAWIYPGAVASKLYKSSYMYFRWRKWDQHISAQRANNITGANRATSERSKHRCRLAADCSSDLMAPMILSDPTSHERLFPTCQVRVVRFYQSCSSSPPPRSPPPPLPPLPCSLPPCQLFAKLFANFRTQWPLLNRWTSTWDLPSSVSTAGPQPGTLRAQWARLDLNLGPAELSEHRWTSTWDLPSSVSSAGPQRPDRMPEDMPDRMPEDMPPDKMPWDMPDRYAR